MYSCSKCREPFLATDEIDLAAVKLPAAIVALAPLARPHLSRLLLFRCPAETCGGLMTAVYLPRTPAPAEKVKIPGAAVSCSAFLR